jgi:predicted glycogen debranching enzyme
MHDLVAAPAPGERLVRHVGDSLTFRLQTPSKARPALGWQARLRTTLGRAHARREEILQAHTAHVAPFGVSWHDVPLSWNGADWSRTFLLAETGFFAAKPYLIDPDGYQHWPPGPDITVSVHPDVCRSANTIYCAFTRLLGPTRKATRLHPEPHEAEVLSLRDQGFAVLPPSGTFRDLQRQLPHIVEGLGCRIIHLLPVHPTPTTFARFGPMGSPYAALDLTAVDPALVEFDQRTTGIEQFVELTRATHRLGARLFLDIVINHTGWGSSLHEEHPEFFRREADGRFACPGAWGNTWEDLVELEPHRVALWDLIAESLLTWCRRGVDGFRCDAGYKIPCHVWQFIIARVHAEFPDAVFLLEGLGGSWEATETLLSEGGMQWAYSELFQNYSGPDIQRYLDYAFAQSRQRGTYVHYSETHDNDRLAARGREWSLLRNRICALTSVQGGFGFTSGVEWLAAEKIRVHERTGLAWDQSTSLVAELAALNRLLADHPAFHDGARITRVSPVDHPAYALHRTDRDGGSPVLILINPQTDQPIDITLQLALIGMQAGDLKELLGQTPPTSQGDEHRTTFLLPQASAFCLAPQPAPPSGTGRTVRDRHARFAWAIQAATVLFPAESLIPPENRELFLSSLKKQPLRWLATLSQVFRHPPGEDRPSRPGDESPAPLSPGRPLDQLLAAFPDPFPNVIIWEPDDVRRLTLVPPGWWLVIRDREGFRAHLQLPGSLPRHAVSVSFEEGHLVAFPPRQDDRPVDASLEVEHHDPHRPRLSAKVRFLAPQAKLMKPPHPESVVLLTNGRGAMARLRLDFGQVRSKYDCALGANLHPDVPVDRHVLVKRVRAWINADGFISPLDGHNRIGIQPGSPARWTFRANAGNGRHVTLHVDVILLPQRNTTLFRFQRQPTDLSIPLTLILRADLEDRSFHAETQRNPGSEQHFESNTQTLAGQAGFLFAPDRHRTLRVMASSGRYHPQSEWSQQVPHPMEAERGQTGTGDAFSPGWFEAHMEPGEQILLALDAEPQWLPPERWPDAFASEPVASAMAPDLFAQTLDTACAAFVARRGQGHTVIAGYPWFLDWGRDTLIAARGLLVSSSREVVPGILRNFARFAENGTLPNSLFGDNASNRDTSDAPLWFGVIVEEAASHFDGSFLKEPVHPGKPSLLETVRDLVEGYLRGTPNGIRVEPASQLVWSPSHFTWMDTNHPAATPRQGYPIEIQALWIRNLQFLAQHDASQAARWETLARQATQSVQALFWLSDRGWYSDVLLAQPGTPASQAIPDHALRPNALFLLGLLNGPADRARSTVLACLRYLLVPGALRSLAPLPAQPPLPVHAADGRLLNDPRHPYWGRYEGDEDTRRKPAYHNGTAWTWVLPTLAEALVKAWPDEPFATRTARALLASADPLFSSACLGHLPEICDGDAPHTPRGCDAQAWSVTEALRVYRLLEKS